VNKPYKNFLKAWPYHVGNMGMNALTFVLSMGWRKRSADDQIKKQLHWVEQNDLAAGPTSFSGNSFTVLSWNIFKGFYEGKLVDIMHDLIREHNPHVVVFQEAPMYSDSSFLEWPEEFVPASFSYVSSQKKVPGMHEFEHTGELTAALMPHSKSTFHLFPKITNQKHLRNDEYLHRNFIYTQYQTRSGSLGLYNVHLESMATPLRRLAEAKALYDVIENHDDDIAVLAGDFNTIMSSPLEPAVQFFRKKGFANGLKPGLKQWVPRLDHIFVRGAKGIRTTVFPRVGSDHKPAIAKILL
jgi:endonuclease/exonuclease/phosphatase family metal-dependent hydrolase